MPWKLGALANSRIPFDNIFWRNNVIFPRLEAMSLSSGWYVLEVSKSCNNCNFAKSSVDMGKWKRESRSYANITCWNETSAFFTKEKSLGNLWASTLSSLDPPKKWLRNHIQWSIWQSLYKAPVALAHLSTRKILFLVMHVELCYCNICSKSNEPREHHDDYRTYAIVLAKEHHFEV